MKRALTNLILAFGSAFMCAAGLHAQSYTLKATVPFAFEAAGHLQEPGTYLVERPLSTPVIKIRNVRQSSSTMLGLATATERSSAKEGARLTFHRYGNQMFLSQVWSAEQTGTTLPVSAEEKRLLRARSELAIVTVPCTTSAVGF